MIAKLDRDIAAALANSRLNNRARAQYVADLRARRQRLAAELDDMTKNLQSTP